MLCLDTLEHLNIEVNKPLKLETRHTFILGQNLRLTKCMLPFNRQVILFAFATPKLE